MASSPERLRKKMILAGFVVRLSTWPPFWDCTLPPFIEFRSLPEFHPLKSEDRTHWPRCLPWQGWHLGFSSRALGSLWPSLLVTLQVLVFRMIFVLLKASSVWHSFWGQLTRNDDETCCRLPAKG